MAPSGRIQLWWDHEKQNRLIDPGALRWVGTPAASGAKAGGFPLARRLVVAGIVAVSVLLMVRCMAEDPQGAEADVAPVERNLPTLVLAAPTTTLPPVVTTVAVVVPTTATTRPRPATTVPAPPRPAVVDGDFWYRLATCESGNGRGSPNQYQFSPDTAAKLGVSGASSLEAQTAAAQRWASMVDPGSTAGWPHCWWVASAG